MIHRNSGFTLIELLIVIVLIGFLFSVVVPFSYARYERYKSAVTAEKVLTFISEKRIQAFLYGKEITISSNEGKLIVNDKEEFKLDDVFMETSQPIKFYPTGTSNGGKIYIKIKDFKYEIEISAPFSNLVLREV